MDTFSKRFENFRTEKNELENLSNYCYVFELKILYLDANVETGLVLMNNC